MDDERRITEQDLDQINRTTLFSSARLARLAGTSLIILGAIGGAAWIWIEYRTQQIGGLTSIGGTGLEEIGLPLADRITLGAAQLPFLLQAALVAGIGFVLRLLADHVLMAAGGSVSGYAVGDPWPGEEDDDEPERGGEPDAPTTAGP